MNKLTKIAPAWHAEAAAELNKDFTEIDALEMTARKRRAYLGLKFHYVKEKGKLDDSIPHGQFEGWMAVNCPAIPERTKQRYMKEAESVCESMGWQIGQIGRFDTPPHKLLELPDVPAKDRKAQQLLLELVEARGKFQPVTEYKQLDKDGSPKRGQLKGSKGCTKEMRLKAKYANEQERLTALELNAGLFISWLKENLNLNGFPRMDEATGGKQTLEDFREAIKEAHLFFQNFEKGGQ